jgi:hypothetical protein
MKVYQFIAVVLLILVAPIVGGANTDENVTVYFEYLTDSDGYNYGANWFVDSDVNAQVYVTAYIISQENVYGSVISGPALLQPNEKHFPIGSFICSDRSKDWSVNVGAKWKRVD